MNRKENQTNYNELILSLSKELRSGKTLTGKDGVFTPLIKAVLEASLEVEMDEHLEQSKQQVSNRRNGKISKQVKSSAGSFEIFTPRDRNGSFEPQTLPKRQRQLTNDLDTKIISLYGKGMSYSDIQDHFKDLYDVDLSVGTINAITDRLLPEILEWQSRPLESVYPVMWLDAMHFKVREQGKVISKAVYSVLGVNQEGEKQVLGIYFGDSESSSFWRSVLY